MSLIQEEDLITSEVHISAAIKLEEHLNAGFNALTYTTSLALERWNKISADCKKYAVDHSHGSIDAISESIKGAVETHRSLIRKSHTVLSEVEDLMLGWSVTLEQRAGVLNKMEARYEGLLESVDHEEGKLVDLQIQQKKAQQRLGDIQADIVVAGAHLEKARQPNVASYASIKQNEKDMDQKIKGLDDRAAELNRREREYQERHDKEKKRRDEMASKIEMLNVRIEEEQVGVLTHLKALQYWQNAVKERSVQVSELKQDLSSKNKAIQGYMQTIGELHSRTMSSQQSSAEVSNSHAAMQDLTGGILTESRATEASRQVHGTVDENDQSKSRRESLQIALTAAEEERDRWKGSHEISQNELAARNLEITNFKRRLHEITTEKGRLGTELKYAQEDLAIAKRRLSNLQAQLAEHRITQENEADTQAEVSSDPVALLQISDHTPSNRVLTDHHTILQTSPDRRKRRRTDRAVAADAEKPTAKRGRPSTANQSAARDSARPAARPRVQAPNNEQEDYVAIAELSKNHFHYGRLPAALFAQIRQQIYQWNGIRSDWQDGTRSGIPKCAHRFANHNGSTMEDGTEGFAWLFVRKWLRFELYYLKRGG
ncbi:MAG: hypothetical protein Q9209_001101 [Squamulea sp. 1 TL-2023]